MKNFFSEEGQTIIVFVWPPCSFTNSNLFGQKLLYFTLLKSFSIKTLYFTTLAKIKFLNFCNTGLDVWWLSGQHFNDCAAKISTSKVT
jgi:hypothetical protein